MKTIVIVVLQMMVLSSVVAVAGTIKVPEDYITIQEALSSAEEGDTVLVSPGTYNEHELHFDGKGVHLLSAGGSDVTVIDGESIGRIFTFDAGETIETEVIGFTMRNGLSDGDGGAVLCVNASPVISECVMENNRAEAHNGGALSCRDSASPTIKNCTISQNFSIHMGGGIYCSKYSSPHITGCVIEENMAGDGLYDGGGIYCTAHSNPVIEACTIRNNLAGNGGGIYLKDSSSPEISSSFIIENRALAGGGGAACFFNSSPSFICTHIENNSSSRQSSYGYDAGGGVLCVYGSSPDFSRCIINGNVSYNGGGVDCIGGSSPRLINCLLSGNYADTDGGALRVSVQSNVSMFFCTVVNNDAGSENEIEGRGYGGGIRINKSAAKIINSIFWDNTAKVDGAQIYLADGYANVTFSDIQGGFTGSGNIEGKPLFIDEGNGDYHLSSSSPCIDKGRSLPSITEDLDGMPRPARFTVGYDMGAYEYKTFSKSNMDF